MPHPEMFPKGFDLNLISPLGSVASLSETQGTDDHIELLVCAIGQIWTVGSSTDQTAQVFQRTNYKGKKGTGECGQHTMNDHS